MKDLARAGGLGVGGDGETYPEHVFEVVNKHPDLPFQYTEGGGEHPLLPSSLTIPLCVNTENSRSSTSAYFIGLTSSRVGDTGSGVGDTGSGVGDTGSGVGDTTENG